MALHIARQGETPDPHPAILYDTDLSRDAEFTFEVCFPVASPLPECADVVCKELPAARDAFTTFLGPYDASTPTCSSPWATATSCMTSSESGAGRLP